MVSASLADLRVSTSFECSAPGRAGGIGFLGTGSFAFAPILFAEGALLSGWIADRVLIDGRPLLSFKVQAIGTAGFLVLVILGPLVMFTPQLAAALRKGSAEYGVLASRLVFCFEEKWVRDTEHEASELLSNEDLRSLSELSNVYTNVRQMRLIPFWTNDIVRLSVCVALPLLPLSLTILSPAELLRFLVNWSSTRIRQICSQGRFASDSGICSAVYLNRKDEYTVKIEREKG